MKNQRCTFLYLAAQKQDATLHSDEDILVFSAGVNGDYVHVKRIIAFHFVPILLPAPGGRVHWGIGLSMPVIG